MDGWMDGMDDDENERRKNGEDDETTRPSSVMIDQDINR
jgi:hypothetical protein